MLIAEQHLNDERLAAFDEDDSTTEELAHLAVCARCRAERQAHLALHAMARDAIAPSAGESSVPRLVEWEELSQAMRKEGLMARPVHLVSATLRSRSLWLRTAAAVVLVLGGTMLGRISAGAPMWFDGASSSLNTPAMTASASLTSGPIASVQQATDVLYGAQRDYERASLWLAGNDTTPHNSDVYRARLAALDQMMTASRAALREAPQDPVLNHYFLTAYTAREATLKQLSAALPVDKTLERY